MVTPRWADAVPIEVETLDLSVSGAACRTRECLPLKTQVGVDLVLPGAGGLDPRRVACEGVVVGSERTGEREWRVAIYFLGLAGDDHEAVRRFVFVMLETDRKGQAATMSS